MIIYTAQYRYSGNDRLDITSKANHILSPPWAIVKAYKYQGMLEEEYTNLYLSLLKRNRLNRQKEWIRLSSLGKVTLVCFCPAGTFCHRFLAAEFMTRKIEGAVYKGERIKI